MKKINKELDRVNRSLSDIRSSLFEIMSKTDLTIVSTKPEKEVGYSNIFMALDEVNGLRHSLESIREYITLINNVIRLHKEFYVVSQDVRLHDLVTHIQETSQIYLDKESAIEERNRINEIYDRNANQIKNYVGNVYKVFSYNYELSVFQELK